MSHAASPAPEPPSTAASPAQGRDLALYRALFAVVAVVYVAWWPVSIHAMGVVIDPFYERCLVGVLGALGWYAASRPRLVRYVPILAELVVYVLPAHYFTLIVRNEYLTTMQFGVFITLASIGLVPRTFARSAIFAFVIVVVAALSCWAGGADRATWIQLFGGVLTFEFVAIGITWRVSGIANARERAEAAALAAKDAAERAARSKDELLARVSHELRTPMNGVINMVQLARDLPLSEAQREYLETARSCAGDMLTLVNDLLDLSKIQAERLHLSPAPFSLAALLEHTLRALGHRAAAKELVLQLTVCAGVPDRLVGDAHRLQQVLANLVDNAIKFTERGAIAVTIARAARQDDPARVRLSFSVADTGSGIAPEALGRIFRAFEQADGSITRRYGGSGLGLAIASELVDLMGGSLTARSTLGVGSTFSFEVAMPPLGEAGTQALPAGEPPASASTAPLRVLVAEDNRTNQEVLRLLLEREGHQVQAADTGAAALELLARHDVDVVLLDIQMPDLDGYEVARRIRAGAVPGKERQVLIAVTAQAMPGDRERCMAAGMDGYLSKPIDRLALRGALTSLGARRSTSPDADETAIDHADLVRRLGDDPEILGSALVAYKSASRALFAAIGQAVEDQAAADLRRGAHSLKGALLTLGAADAARAAAALEELGKTGRWGTQRPALATLERELSRVDACIASRYAPTLPALAAASRGDP